jgi:hypothetical protein
MSLSRRAPGRLSGQPGSHYLALRAPLAILDSIDVHRGARVRGREGRLLADWPKSKRLGRLYHSHEKPCPSTTCADRLDRSGPPRGGAHLAGTVLNHLPPKLMRAYDKNKYEMEKQRSRKEASPIEKRCPRGACRQMVRDGER